MLGGIIAIKPRINTDERRKRKEEGWEVDRCP
jgi:hypothetical protein